MTRLLAEMTASGKSAILVSPDNEDLLTLADRIAVVTPGGIRAVWDAREARSEDLDAVIRGESPVVSAPTMAATVIPEVALTSPPELVPALDRA